MTWRLFTADFALTWLIQSTVLLALGLLAGRLLKRTGPAVQSAWYRTTLVAVLLCPCASMLLAAIGFTGLMVHLPGKIAADGAQSQSISPLMTTRDGSIDGQQVQLGNGIDAPTNSMAAPSPGAPPLITSTPIESSTASWPALPKPEAFTEMIGWGVSFGLAVWLLGSSILGARLFAGHRRMARLRACAVRAEPDAEALCNDLALRMGLSLPLVLRTPFLSSPCLDGLRRPAILLPEDAEGNLRETFMHELAHLSRRDGLWNLVRRCATAMLWGQPLLWVLSRRMEVAAEEVCDDYVVQLGADRTRYAGLLLDLAERTLPPLAPSAVGMISLRSLLARRVTRILDSSRTLSTRAGARAIAATLLAGLVGTLLAGLIGVGGANPEVLGDEPKSEKPQTALDPSPNTPRKTVNGRVVDPEGKPVAGAIVTVGQYRRAAIGSFGEFADRREVDRAIADREGRFRLTFEDIDPGSFGNPEMSDRWSMPAVVAWAPGFGPAWPETFAREVTEDKPLRLVRDDVPITGRVVDLEGRPVSGATIRINMLNCPRSTEEVDRWLTEAAKEPAGGAQPQPNYFPTKEQCPGCELAISAPATTDLDGRFRLTGLGRDRMATLDISGPSIAFRRVQVVTRPMKPVENRAAEGPPLFDLGYHGADCTIVVEPGRPIEGVVHDAETKAPIAGATVTGEMLGGSIWSVSGLNVAVTDAQGHYRLVGLPKGNGHSLVVYPSLDQPYFITGSLVVTAGPGLEPVRFDIPLKRGLWITGKVSDAKTGHPVQSAIHYYPFLANKRAEGLPNFQPNSISFNWTASRYRTDVDGRFRVVGLPGRGIVAAKSFDRSYRIGVGADSIPERPSQQANRREALPTYNQIHPLDFHAIAEVNPPDGVAEFNRDLALEPSLSLNVQLVDEQGKPIPGVTARGRFPRNLDYGDNNLYDRSRTQIAGLDSTATRMVVFLHHGRKLGAVLIVKPEDAVKGGERTVTLRPCPTVTGRVVDADGKPVSGGVEIRLANQGKPQYPGLLSNEISLPGVSFDTDGRFRVDELAPGGTYRLQAKDRLYSRVKMEPERFKQFELAGNLSAEPGQVIDLGTFNAAAGKLIKAPEKQTAAETKDVPINGRIVDLEGRPVTGVSVKVGGVQGPKTGDLTAWIEGVKKGEPPWIAYRQLGADVKIPEAFRREVTTDNDGRFRFEGLGRERVVELTIKGDTVAYTSIDIVTRRTEPFPARGFPDTHGPGSQTVYGSDFTYTANPARPVEGMVRDAKTRRPMAGVSVQSWRFAGSDFVDTRQLKTISDEDGRFRIVGMPKGKGNVVIAVPSDDQPYFMREAPVGDPPGIGPVPVEIELHRGVMITGRITDKSTGKPVAGARLHYLPFLENTFVQALPEFDKDGNVDGFQTRYTTGGDGTYKLVGMPGRAIVGVESVDKTPYRSGAGSETIKGLEKKGFYKTWHNPIWPGRSWPNTLMEINPAEGTETLTVDAQLDPGLTLRIKVVDADGKPVPDASVVDGSRKRPGESTPEALFTLSSFRPDEVRNVVVRHEVRSLGKVVRLRAGEDATGPVVVTIASTATIKGRVVDADGNPVPATTVRVDVEPTEGFLHQLANVAANRDGRFEVLKVPVGCEYGLVAESGTMIKQRRVAFGKASVKPGETTDVGEIRFKND